MRSPRRAPVAAAAVLAALCALLHAALCFAGEDPPEGAEQHDCARQDDCELIRIAAIDIQGLGRTKAYVIHRELLVEEGDLASQEIIEESIARVRNTGLFRKVSFELVDVSGDAAGEEMPSGHRSVELRIEVDEKWTTLPIFSVSSGGGTYRLVLGAFDTNLLGRYIGVGGQYVRLGDTNSFYVWAYHPRAFGQRLRLGVDAGSRSRIFTLYDDDGVRSGGFMLERFTVGASARKEWLWWLRTEAALRYDNDDFSFEFIPEPIADRQREQGLPAPTRFVTGHLSASLGRIDQDNYLFEGTVFSVGIDHANSALGSTYDETKLGMGLTHFERLPLKSNLAVRLAAATSNVHAVHRRYYLGGLDTIRGFARDRFAGEQFWLAGAEYRIPSLDMRWLVLQHLVFVDAAGVSDRLDGLGTLSGASAGVGLRIIVPKIQGFIARIDYAFPLSGDGRSPLSLGGGQFF